jgi:hypothetical protein
MVDLIMYLSNHFQKVSRYPTMTYSTIIRRTYDDNKSVQLQFIIFDDISNNKVLESIPDNVYLSNVIHEMSIRSSDGTDKIYRESRDLLFDHEYELITLDESGDGKSFMADFEKKTRMVLKNGLNLTGNLFITLEISPEQREFNLTFKNYVNCMVEISSYVDEEMSVSDFSSIKFF